MLGSLKPTCLFFSSVPTACLCTALPPQGGLGSSKQQMEALLALRSGYPRAALATHALAGFAAASLSEDRFGVLQLSQVMLVLRDVAGFKTPCRQLIAATVPCCPLRSRGWARCWCACWARWAPRSSSCGPLPAWRLAS